MAWNGPSLDIYYTKMTYAYMSFMFSLNQSLPIIWKEYILMKKFIIWVMCITLASVVGCNTAKAQNVKREGKTFIAESSRGASTSSDVQTTYKWKDNKGQEYPIVLHKYTKGNNGGKWGAYVIRKSDKTGKDYKYYFPKNEEIAKEIQKEMGI